jgi:NRPS condensation-like uncharacterized protein
VAEEEIDVTTAELNVLDQLFLHMDREEEPWSVQFELELPGRIDAERLSGAIVRAAGRHPVARASMADWESTDSRYHWEIADELERAPLEVVECEDAEQVEVARERVLSAGPPLDSGPPFTMTLAHAPEGDTLMLNLHHAAGDGMAALALMTSVLRAYAGDDDPKPSVDPLAVRKVEDLVNPGSIAARIKRGQALFEQLGKMASPPVRVAPQGAAERPGYGFELLRLDDEETGRVVARRRGDATVNDVLLAALAIALRRWNEQHEGEGGRVALTMPVNLRPPEWRTEVLANFASYVTVSLGEDEQQDLDAAIDATAEHTRRIKDGGLGALAVDVLSVPSLLPAAVKQNLRQMISITGDRVIGTAMLSNLGRLPELPPAGDAGEPRAVWFSPPALMPLGTSFGAASIGAELFLTLRYRHALLDPEAAAELMGLYRELLLG